MAVAVGLAILPEMNPSHDDRWRLTEALGFAHAWCFDHLAWRSLADAPWHATVPTLAAAAMTTSIIPIGTFVTSPNYRHPVVFSRDLMTLDVMSGGRLVVAIGAGAPGNDADVLGSAPLSPRERQDRFEEFVSLLDLLLRRPETTWSGQYFTAVKARTIPGPARQPRPPFVIAGNGPRGMRLAMARGEGWATMGTAPHGSEPDVWWRGVADAAARFNDLTAQSGGESRAGFRRYLDMMAGGITMDSAERLVDDISRAAELGYTDIVLPWPRPNAPFIGSVDLLERFAERLVDGALPV
jgi:alkanesulfonate monooxygenase SsuD/methylene tetrahydromethanopterin reductase-like flavin-dependent oxidoreductase (luciferase family)